MITIKIIYPIFYLNFVFPASAKETQIKKLIKKLFVDDHHKFSVRKKNICAY
jgi:hypothetical protein